MKSKKRIIGAGFSGLDIIMADYNNILPGGTCANVLTVLASFGWSSNLIKAAYNEPWNSYVDKLLNSKSVQIYEYGDSRGDIPRVIQVNTGETHFFHTVCPKCSKKLMNINLPSSGNIKNMELEIKDLNVFFYDRISSGINFIAQEAKGNSVWTFYEPNSSRTYKNLYNNIYEADIVKFSAERISMKTGTALKEELTQSDCITKLIIITLGERGIAYSLKDEKKRFSDWCYIDATIVDTVIDTSGAGDWLTAGFLDKFVDYYPQTLAEITHDRVHLALVHGQKMSQICCNYLGALGAFFIYNNFEVHIEDSKCSYCLI